MNRELLLSLSEAVLSSLDAGESPRKIVDALVRRYGATCEWQGGRWTLRMMRVSVEGEAVNGTLLRSWAVRAAELAALPVVGFDDVAAAKAAIRKRRKVILNRTGRDDPQTATGCQAFPAIAQPSEPLASEEMTLADYAVLTSHWSMPVPAGMRRFGPYLWLRSEKGGVLFRQRSDGRVVRVRLVGSAHIGEWHFYTRRIPLRTRFRLLVGRIATAFRRPLPTSATETTRVPETPTPHNCPNPSTRPSVANRFRFSADGPAHASVKGGDA